MWPKTIARTAIALSGWCLTIAFQMACIIVANRITKKPGEHIFIPLEAIHRVQNSGKKPIKIVEAQVGSILKETDIVRYQDVYGRVK